MTLDICYHFVWMLTWMVWKAKTSVNWHRVSQEISSMGLYCCHWWFGWVLVVGCLISWVLFAWTHLHMNLSTPSCAWKSAAAKANLVLEPTSRALRHSPGAQWPWDPLDRLMTTRWKVETPSLDITRRLAWKHVVEQTSLGWLAHHRLSSHLPPLQAGDWWMYRTLF